MKALVTVCWTFWLGAAPGVFWGSNAFHDPKWWALVIPVLILVKIERLLG